MTALTKTDVLLQETLCKSEYLEATKSYNSSLIWTGQICSYFKDTVKLGFNELGYNEHSVITNKNIYLVGLVHFYDKFSWL